VVCGPVGRSDVAAAVDHAIAERAATCYSQVSEVLVRPPDRFVAGEESALANWLENGQSLPVFRPHKGIALRIGNQRALVHNTETLAHIALIARRGPEAILARGTDDEPGTCLVTISGAVAQPGVVEVDRGTPLLDIARRSSPVQTVQALLVGGYGGAWVGFENLATPYSFRSLRTIGAATGVGVVVVLGESSCGVAETARIARYLADQSSGQCGRCVFGLPAISDDLDRLAAGHTDRDIIGRVQRRLLEVSGRGACGHPDGAVNLVRSAMSVFHEDVAAHARGLPCDHRNNPTILRLPLQVA
jgi:NADH:ubiquinone oxidoreductase subunit F (NADH-binding)